MVYSMDTSNPTEESYLQTALEVSSSTASTIHLQWQVHGRAFPFIQGFQVHYQKVASTYIQYGPPLSSSSSEYSITNLVADTYYKVCLVTFRNDTASPPRDCVDASTTNWQLPVSIGSSIGAVLALTMIVLIVLLSRCQFPLKYRRKSHRHSNKYDNMSSTYPDHYDFSDTMTQGHEDDFFSEQDESYAMESSGHYPEHCKFCHGHRTCDRMCNGNKNHVFPHYLSSQSRSPSSRPNPLKSTRGYSMQSCDVQYPLPRSPLTKEAPSHHSFTKDEWQRSLDASSMQKYADKTRSDDKDHFSDRATYGSISDDKIKSPFHSKSSEFTFPQRKQSDFIYIDETSDDKTSYTSDYVSRDGTEHRGSQREMSLQEDLSIYGASGGDPPDTMQSCSNSNYWESPNPVEMSSVTPAILVSNTPQYEEHSV